MESRSDPWKGGVSVHSSQSTYLMHDLVQSEEFSFILMNHLDPAPLTVLEAPAAELYTTPGIDKSIIVDAAVEPTTTT